MLTIIFRLFNKMYIDEAKTANDKFSAEETFRVFAPITLAIDAILCLIVFVWVISLYVNAS